MGLSQENNCGREVNDPFGEGADHHRAEEGERDGRGPASGSDGRIAIGGCGLQGQYARWRVATRGAVCTAFPGGQGPQGILQGKVRIRSRRGVFLHLPCHEQDPPGRGQVYSVREGPGCGYIDGREIEEETFRVAREEEILGKWVE